MTSNPSKPKPKVGDTAFEVGWCAGIPKDENGDSDHDRADCRYARFKTHEAAVKYAKEVLPKDAYGSVSVTPIEFVAYDEDHAASHPHVGFWEHSSDGEHISDF